MMMQMEEEEEEAMILEYGNYSNYYVQSPSSVSHANSTVEYAAELCSNSQLQLLHRSPLQEESYPTKLLVNQIKNNNQDDQAVAARASTFSNNNNNNNNLSRCSSSRASTTSFVHRNMPSAHHDANVSASNKDKLIVSPATTALINKKLDDDDDDDDDQEDLYNFDNDQGNCWQYFSFNTYPSSLWIALQLLWRFLVSAMLALLVFYLVTNPPPPHISVKVIEVKQFELTEGVDITGVATTLLNCNISMALIIDNRSKVFGVHILYPVVNIYFGRVPFVISQGARMYVRSREWREMSVYAGTTKKAMYGGGRNMEDMLNSQTGLPLLITLTFNSYFRVVSNLIHSHFHHQAHCLLLLHNSYDLKHHTPTHSLNTTCNLLTS